MALDLEQLIGMNIGIGYGVDEGVRGGPNRVEQGPRLSRSIVTLIAPRAPDNVTCQP